MSDYSDAKVWLIDIDGTICEDIPNHLIKYTIQRVDSKERDYIENKYKFEAENDAEARQKSETKRNHPSA